MQLRELLKHLTVQRVDGPTDRDVTGITYDSRRVTPGSIFVATRGQNVDGHEFIPNAIDRGAIAVICEQNGFASARITKIKVADSRETMAIAAAVFFGHPAAKLKVIGVTGTNGKTTVAFMVKQMLERAGISTGLIGTIQYEVGDRIIPAHRTTPESLEVQQMLAHMVRAGCKACVMEVSSHALDQKRVHAIEFDAAIFTNLTQDHLDYHGTMENYFAAKKRLFTGLQQGTKSADAVINIDDAFGQRLALETNAEVQLTYGLRETASVRATRIELGCNGTTMRIEMPGASFACTLPLIGRHNVYNALAATGAGLVLKLTAEQIRSALNSTHPVPGRLERVAEGQPFSVFIDYAHTDDALQNVLRTLREITTGRLIVAFGCGGSRDKGKRPKMGAVAAELADFALITSDNPRKESPAEIAAQIEQGYRSIRGSGCGVELDRRRAIDQIIRMARPGDTVLLAGKGHETYQEFEDTVIPFDDRVYARESLEHLGHTAREAAA